MPVRGFARPVLNRRLLLFSAGELRSGLRTWLAVLVVAVAAAPGYGAVFEPRDFRDPQAEQRYRVMINELRCLVCQNQNLADSNAELATDLRRQIFEMIERGDTDDQIIEFMVSRYGDFVLYRPPLNPATVLLWAGPFLFGIAALGVLVVQILRRRSAGSAEALSDAERHRLEEIVERKKGEKR